MDPYKNIQEDKMINIKKISVLLVLALLLISSMPLFSNGQNESTDDTVVLLMIGMESPYCPPYVSNFTTQLNEANIKTFMFNGKFDAQLQASQMDQAIAMKPAMIVLFAADSQAMAPGIKKAYSAGIPVLMSNNRPVKESEEYTIAYVGPDYYTQGELAGEMMNELLKSKGKIVMIEGLAGQEAQINRAKGFEDKLKNLGADIEIMARQTAGWRKDLAVQVMQDFITRYGETIDAIYAHDDTMAIGAAISIEEAGYKLGAIPIVSIGGSREGLKSVADGLVFGTVMQSPVVETDFVIPFVIEAVEKGMKAGDSYDQYWNFMQMPQVSKANVDEFLPGDW